MKKVFLSLALCAVAFAASAQFKSVDAKMIDRWGFGFGAGVTVGIGESIEIAPSVALAFPGGYYGTDFMADVDVHYILPLDIHENLELYPLAGADFIRRSYDALGVDWSESAFGVNVGAGARWHFNDQWAAFAEDKYNIVSNDWISSSNYLSVGISFKF